MKTFFFIAYPILNRFKHQPNFYTFQNRIKNLCHSSNLSIFKFILIKPMIYIDWEMLLYHYWWCDESFQNIEVYKFVFPFSIFKIGHNENLKETHKNKLVWHEFWQYVLWCDCVIIDCVTRAFNILNTILLFHFLSKREKEK